MKKKILKCCMVSALLLTSTVYAQQIQNIRGMVADTDGKPLSGVVVQVPGTKKQALTDVDGYFDLPITEGTKLSFSHPDFYSQETCYKKKGRFIVQMASRAMPGPEDKEIVVDRLRGTSKKGELTETIGFINGTSVTSTPTYNFLGAIQGRMPGLNIYRQGGDMPAAYGWKVRNSRTNLFLVDGIERDFYTMDPDQIESVQVLKDGLSTVMLGQRSAAGVINVITKKGNVGRPRFSFTAETGFEKALKLPDLLGAVDYITLVNEAYANDLREPGAYIEAYNPAIIEKYRNKENPYLYPDVDWYDELLNNTAPVHRYNFNVSGATNSFNYFVDLDWYRENGFFKTNDANSYNTNAQTNRFSVRSNLGVKVTSTTFMQINLAGRQERYNQPAAGTRSFYSNILTTRPNRYPVYNPDGSYGSYIDSKANQNLKGLLYDNGHQFKDSRHMSFDLTIKQKMDFLLDGLYLEATGSYYSATSYLTTRSKEFAAYLYKEDGSYQQVGEDKDQGNSGNKDQRYRITFLKGAVGYDHSFGKHKVAALFVADLNQIQDQNVQKGYLRNYTNYSGRMNYNYDDRYLAEAVYTRGGYNWLAPGNRWADYWGVGAAWNGHNESFVKELNIFSTLKPRISYAVTGQAICDYAEYKQSYGTSKVHLYGGPFDNKWTEENKTASRLNPEIAKKLNVGIDLGFLNDRLAFTFDYYQNRFSDVVATSEIKTAILGNVYPRSNCEKYSYTGTEMVLTWQDRIRNFNYFINGNLSFEQSKFEYSPQLPKAYPWMSRLGDPVGMTYGYVADGIFQSQEEIDAHDAFLTSAVKSTIMPGDIRYKDLNGDHIIDIHDQTNLGSKKAKGYYGISAGFNYKGFDFSVFAQGTLNRQVYLNGDFTDGSGKKGEGAITSYVLGRWTPDNHTNTQTRIWYDSNNNNRQTSSFWIYDADYFRLKNVEIGYTLPTLLTRKLGIPSVRIYAQGMNLLTASEIFDVRDDIDPEIWGGSFPMTRTINFGISIKL